MADGLFQKLTDGVQLLLHLTPKASANRIQGLSETADGHIALKVTVTAVPEDGKANAALLKLLAKTWKLPKTSLTIASGATSRRKVVQIAGDPAALYAMLIEWGRTIE